MGITETSVMTNFFKSAKAKMQFQDSNCFKWETSKCEDCIIREMLDAFFGDQEDREEEKKKKRRKEKAQQREREHTAVGRKEVKKEP